MGIEKSTFDVRKGITFRDESLTRIGGLETLLLWFNMGGAHGKISVGNKTNVDLYNGSKLGGQGSTGSRIFSAVFS